MQPFPARFTGLLPVRYTKISRTFRLGCGWVRSQLQPRLQYVALLMHWSSMFVRVGTLQAYGLIADQAANRFRFEVKRIRHRRRDATTRSVHKELPHYVAPNVFLRVSPVCTLEYRTCGNLPRALFFARSLRICLRSVPLILACPCLVPNHVARYDHPHTTVQLPSRGRAVIRDRVGLAPSPAATLSSLNAWLLQKRKEKFQTK